MKNKEKKKVHLFDPKQFTSREEAQEYLDNSESTLKRKKICTLVSILSTVGLIMLQTGASSDNTFLNILAIVGVVFFLAGLIATMVCGSILSTLKVSIVCAKIGWYVVPVFPIDLAAAGVGFIVGIAIFFYAPVIICLLSLKQTKNSIVIANEFLNSSYAIISEQ